MFLKIVILNISKEYMELQLLIAFFCSFACLTYVMFHLPDASKCHLCIKINISKMEIADSARYCCFTYLLTHIYFEKKRLKYTLLPIMLQAVESVSYQRV